MSQLVKYDCTGQENKHERNMSALNNLPSRGLCCKAGTQGRTRTASVPLYFATHDTAPPPDQFITTDKTSKLLKKFHEYLAKQEAGQGKRPHAEVSGPSRERDRVRQKL